MNTGWIAWQLCDSGFPAGAFAHSAGLEAAWQQGEVAGADGLTAWATCTLHQAGRAAIPFVAAAWSGDRPLREVDACCDALLLNHVANQASRALGQAMLAACVRAFATDPVKWVGDEARRDRLPGHHAPVLGALGKALGLSKRATAELFVFLALRGTMSAAVRLGVVGPLQAQTIQHRLGAQVQTHIDDWLQINLDDVAQTAPLADLLQGTQERLYSRLFVS
jgi:urease accessory protein